MKKVLILAARFVETCDAAARNLCEAMEADTTDIQVQVLDLFEPSSGSLKSIAQKAYSGFLRLAGASRGGINGSVDTRALTGTGCFRVGRLQRALGEYLEETQPDVVVCTYPAYAGLIWDLYRDHAERPFRVVSVITDAAGVQPGWLQGPSDLYCVRNQAVAAELRSHSIPVERIKVCGFPVGPLPARFADISIDVPENSGPFRILYLAESDKKRVLKTLKRLLDREENQLTITVGRNAYLKAVLAKKLKKYGCRAQVLGWTNRIPYLLRTHHLVIARAGGIMAEEALAARCPMIAAEMAPGQESQVGLIEGFEVGAAAIKPRQIAECVKYAFKHDGKLWKKWRANLGKISRPEAARDISQWVLGECEAASAAPLKLRAVADPVACATAVSVSSARQLLCDFHIHTNYSDGKLTVAEVVDFYGSRQFDCICITDHLADSRRLIGKLGKLSRLTLSPNQLEEYFDVIDRERRRAWRKYNMLVMAGLEFNKDGLTSKSSAHLLGVDLTNPILDWLDLPETIAQIHGQGGLSIASHPHIMKSEWGKDTLYLWEKQEQFIPLIDAWEIANRNNMFNPVSAKRLPYVANSDFHKPKHIYSWKTLVSCEKERDAIKECIRRNERIAITLYREPEFAHQQLPATSMTATGALSGARMRTVSSALPAA